MQKNNNNNMQNYARFSGIVVEMLVIIGGGTWLGKKLDEQIEMEFPLMTVILSLLSVGIALYLVFNQLNRINKNNDK